MVLGTYWDKQLVTSGIGLGMPVTVHSGRASRCPRVCSQVKNGKLRATLPVCSGAWSSKVMGMLAAACYTQGKLRATLQGKRRATLP